MARDRATTSDRKYVTPALGIPKNLMPITFGSYLPIFRSIAEAADTSSLEDELQLQSINQESREPFWGLQFSDGEASAHPTTTNEPERGNRSEGKSLKYVPQTLKDGVLTFQIEKDDIKDHVKTWESALIGYVL